jgi:hypothetical protein
MLQNVGLVPASRRRVARQPQPNIEFVRRYFHILGIDIMLNDRCEPIVLELNDRPSMCVTYEIEHILKTQLVYDALNVITVDGTDPRDETHPGGWQRLFPTSDKSTFAQATQSMLDRSSQRAQMTAKRMLVKRFGYLPSTHYVAKSPVMLPKLHQ